MGGLRRAVGAVNGSVGVVDGLVEGGDGVGVAEPGGDVADGEAVGVVEVVARCEELDDRGAIGGESAVHGIEEAGVEALLEEDVS